MAKAATFFRWPPLSTGQDFRLLTCHRLSRIATIDHSPPAGAAGRIRTRTVGLRWSPLVSGSNIPAESAAASVVVEAKLAELLGLLGPLAKAAVGGLVREVVSGPLAARIQVWPAGALPPEPNRPPRKRTPTACEADLLSVLRAAGRNLTKPEIERRLDTLGRTHGDSTLLRTLARMVRTGVLTNAHDGHGYGLPPSPLSP
jgi:hypothetical protein